MFWKKKMFPGGVHPEEGINGKKVNGINPITVLEAPPRVVIPLQQHIGAPAKVNVNKGDHVKIGQVIGVAGGYVSAPVHASVSGTVVDIQNCMLANGTMTPAVVIDNDYAEEWVELIPTDHAESLSIGELQMIIRDAGIVGLGGATFPTAVKLTPPAGKQISMLVINGAECEPYLTADHRLMLEKSADIIDGIRLMMLALDVKQAIIGIENNKQDAIDMLSAAAQKVEGIRVQGLPVRYPQGGEKQLIYALTKKQVPNGGLPIDVGVVVCNVGTVYAVDRAIREGRPLIDRVTTVGGLVNNPGNFLVRIGTPISYLIQAAGGFSAGIKQFIYGGPMMGQSIARTDIPVTKGCSGIVALGNEAMEPQESPCIRCGRCIQACPMKLIPTKIDANVRLDQFDEAEKLGAMNCLECGACTYACPAKRSLTQSCRVAKNTINRRRKIAQKKEEARKAQELEDLKKAEAEAAAAQETMAKEEQQNAELPAEKETLQNTEPVKEV